MSNIKIEKAVVPESTEELFKIGENGEPTYVKITPVLAKEILVQCNQKNRPLSENTVKRYVKDMLNGSWQDGANTISFSVENTLIDGQHRLHAVVESQRSSVFLTAFKNPLKMFAVMDIGKKRSGSDTLSVNGFTNTATLSSMIRKYHHYCSKQGNMWNINTPCSNEEILEIAMQNNQFSQAASYVDSNKNVPSYGNKSDIATCFAIFNKIDSQKAKAFMELAFNRNDFFFEGKDYTTLFSSLRQILMKNKNTSNKIHNGKKTDVHEAESRTFWYMFLAWNYFIAKENKELVNKVSRERFPLVQKWE